jgi:hypothetical protein
MWALENRSLVVLFARKFLVYTLRSSISETKKKIPKIIRMRLELNRSSKPAASSNCFIDLKRLCLSIKLSKS